MTAPVLADALGPRARRRVAVASIVAGVGLAMLAVVVVRRLDAKGQLRWELWEPFTEWPVLRFFLGGLVNTLQAGLVAMVLAMFVGGALALMRLSRTAPVRWLATTWVEFFRGVPLLLLIFFCFSGLRRSGVDISSYSALVMGLTLYNGAVLGEIYRAGILSLDRGQSEAAYAVGLGYWQAMFTVIIPQAARRMTPAIVSQLITLLKDTSLGSFIIYEELLRRARINGEFSRNILQSYLFVALIYIVINLVLSRVARRLEVRQRRRLGAGALQVAGVEDLTVVETQAEASVARP